MKNIAFYLALLILCGCNVSGQQVANKADADNECADKPETGALKTKDVKDISLSSAITKVSGNISAGKHIGYKFNGKSGEKLSYRTSDDICVWVYAPDNTLLSSGDLPAGGSYIVQVSAPKGSTSYNLEMSLGSLTATAPSPSSSPDTSSSSSSTLDTSSSSSSTPDTSSSPSTPEAADLIEAQAVDIVRGWYDAKPQMFAPPFDESLVKKYTTGILYRDTLKLNGSIDWLRKNNAFYTYDFSNIEEVVSFSNSGSRPSLTVRINEKLRYTKNSKIGRVQNYTANVTYYFEKDGGDWKIYDYDVVKKQG